MELTIEDLRVIGSVLNKEKITSGWEYTPLELSVLSEITDKVSSLIKEKKENCMPRENLSYSFRCGAKDRIEKIESETARLSICCKDLSERLFSHEQKI